MAHKVKLHGAWVTVPDGPRRPARRPLRRVNWTKAAIRGDTRKLTRRPG